MRGDEASIHVLAQLADLGLQLGANAGNLFFDAGNLVPDAGNLVP